MKPTKAEKALVMLLDGTYADYDLDSGYDVETNKKILAIRDEIVSRHPDIYSTDLEDTE
jgi:hypothetical protein